MISQRAERATLGAAFVVRSMTMADIPAVMAIERRVFPSPWPESAYRYELRFRTDSFFFVLQPEEKASPPLTLRERVFGKPAPPVLMGYAGFRLREESAHICTIAVHPDWRGRGLGKFLLLLILRKSVARGLDRVTLEVRPSNRVARRLYARAGFVRTAVRQGYYRDGEDAWVMTLYPLDDRTIARLDRMQKQIEAGLTDWIDQTGR